MSVKKVENQIRKMRQNADAYEKTNPKIAAKIRAKISSMKGKKK